MRASHLGTTLRMSHETQERKQPSLIKTIKVKKNSLLETTSTLSSASEMLLSILFQGKSEKTSSECMMGLMQARLAWMAISSRHPDWCSVLSTASSIVSIGLCNSCNPKSPEASFIEVLMRDMTTRLLAVGDTWHLTMTGSSIASTQSVERLFRSVARTLLPSLITNVNSFHLSMVKDGRKFTVDLIRKCLSQP